MSDQALPSDSKARKDIPLARGLLDYFPAALAAVAEVSRLGNEKHNPGEELHHARGKSNDHADCILRHLVDRGTVDPEDGQLHSAKIAWRALALLQEELEAAGAPLARGARIPEPQRGESSVEPDRSVDLADFQPAIVAGKDAHVIPVRRVDSGAPEYVRDSERSWEQGR